VAAESSWLEATLAREAIWQGKWRYSGGVGGRPEPESCILYPPTLTEPLRLRIWPFHEGTVRFGGHGRAGQG